MRPGRRAGPSPHPRRRGRRLRPRRPLPDARVVVHDGRRRRRSPASSTSSPARRPSARAGIHPAMLYAMRTSGADAVVCARRRPGAGGDGLRPDRGHAGGRHARRRGQRLRRRGQAPAVRPRRDRPAGRPDRGRWSSPTRPPTRELVAADLLGQAEHGPTSPAGVIAIGEDVGARGHGRGRRRCSETWPTAEVAGEAWRDHGWVAIAADDDEAIALADEAANEHLEVQVAEEKLDDVPGAAAQLRLAVPRRRRRPWPTATRRSARTTSCRRSARRALHGRPLGREVPQDLHLPAADRRRAPAGWRRRSRRSARRRTSPATA